MGEIYNLAKIVQMGNLRNSKLWFQVARDAVSECIWYLQLTPIPKEIQQLIGLCTSCSEPRKPKECLELFFLFPSLFLGHAMSPKKRKRRVLNDFPEESKIFARLTREAAFFLEPKWTWHENLQELICGSFIAFNRGGVLCWVLVDRFLGGQSFLCLVFFFLWKGRLEISIFWEFSGETFSRPSFPVTLFDTWGTSEFDFRKKTTPNRF